MERSSSSDDLSLLIFVLNPELALGPVSPVLSISTDEESLYKWSQVVKVRGSNSRRGGGSRSLHLSHRGSHRGGDAHRHKEVNEVIGLGIDPTLSNSRSNSNLTSSNSRSYSSGGRSSNSGYICVIHNNLDPLPSQLAAEPSASTATSSMKVAHHSSPIRESKAPYQVPAHWVIGTEAERAGAGAGVGVGASAGAGAGARAGAGNAGMPLGVEGRGSFEMLRCRIRGGALVYQHQHLSQMDPFSSSLSVDIVRRQPKQQHQHQH